MSLYLVEASYTPEAIAALVKNPQDRAEAIRPLVEKLGGKLHGFWFTYGDRDIVAIAEFDDPAAAVGFGMAVGQSGAMKRYATTPLMTPAEAMKAMRRAAEVAYKPPR
jgi:uncharacterized protein with GYD domain